MLLQALHRQVHHLHYLLPCDVEELILGMPSLRFECFYIGSETHTHCIHVKLSAS